MSHQPSMTGHRLAIAALAVGLTVSSASTASAEYRVWFFDNLYETYEMGDITDGSSPLYVAPDWACKMRVNDPSYYRWVNEYGETLDSDDDLADIIIRVPNLGCAAFGVLNGNQPLLPPEGASYLEITTSHGHDWLDADDGWPDCGGCAVADEITDFPHHTHYLNFTLSAHRTVLEAVVNERTQSGAADAIVALAGTVAQLRLSVSQDVAARRRLVVLSGREGSIRPLEDAALRTLDNSRRQLDSCAARAREWRFGDAFISCTLGGHDLESAQSLLQALQFTFEKR